MKRERHLYRYHESGLWIVQMGAVGGLFGYCWFGPVWGVIGYLGMTAATFCIALAYHMQRDRNLEAWIKIREVLEEEWPEIKDQRP